MSLFKPATKTAAKLRMALTGPAGSGKTMSALKIARGLGARIALIDTERGSASKYAGDVAEFDVLELVSFHPDRYIEGIKAAETSGYDVLIIDSLSHAWNGRDGVLELKDRAASSDRNGNGFSAWGKLTPLQNALIDAILGANLHVICTMRAKTEYVLERDERGKQVPRKVGMAPIQRDGVEYEFDVLGELDADHVLTITKTRHTALAGASIQHPGRELGESLAAWLSEGEAVDPDPAVRKMRETIAERLTVLADLDKNDAAREVLARYGYEHGATRDLEVGRAVARDLGRLIPQN